MERNGDSTIRRPKSARRWCDTANVLRSKAARKQTAMEQRISATGQRFRPRDDRFQQRDTPSGRCYNCGDRDHRSFECPRRSQGAKCFECREFGHLAINCPKKKTPATEENLAVRRTLREKYFKNVLICERERVERTDNERVQQEDYEGEDESKDKYEAAKNFDSGEVITDNTSDEDVTSNEAITDELVDKYDEEVAEVVKYKNVLVYMDNFIIPSVDCESWLSKLNAVLRIASESGLRINWNKYRFLQEQVEYLGHIVEDGTVRPSERRTEAVARFPSLKPLKTFKVSWGLWVNFESL